MTSVEVVKAQIITSIEQLYSLLIGRENEALLFILKVLLKCTKIQKSTSKILERLLIINDEFCTIQKEEDSSENVLSKPEINVSECSQRNTCYSVGFNQDQTTFEDDVTPQDNEDTLAAEEVTDDPDEEDSYTPNNDIAQSTNNTVEYCLKTKEIDTDGYLTPELNHESSQSNPSNQSENSAHITTSEINLGYNTEEYDNVSKNKIMISEVVDTKDKISFNFIDNSTIPSDCNISNSEITDSDIFVDKTDNIKEIDNSLSKPINCFLCCKFLNNHIDFISHICSHSGTAVSCKICKKTFKNKCHYAGHTQFCKFDEKYKGHPYRFLMSKVSDMDLKKFSVCPYCGSKFKRSCHLKAHLKTMLCVFGYNLKMGMKFPCRYCRMTFFKDTLRQEHVSKIHTHACPVCKKTFSTVRLLSTHRLTHKRVHHCTHCSESFSTRAQLRNHAAELHKRKPAPGPNFHSCPDCDYKCKKKNNLERHRRLIHSVSTEPAVLACSICPALLSSTQGLVEHERAHGDPSYECSECSRVFRHRASLVRHVARHGSTVGSTCPTCARRFSRREHMLKHAHAHHPDTLHDQPKRYRRPNRRAHKPLTPAVVKESQQAPAATVAPSSSEQQFVSLVDVRSGEMLTLPAASYAHLLLPTNTYNTDQTQYNAGVDNIVLLTNVPTLECAEPMVIYEGQSADLT